MDRSDPAPFYRILTDNPDASRSSRPGHHIEEDDRLAILEVAKKFSTTAAIRNELVRSEAEMVCRLGGNLLLALVEAVTGRGSGGGGDEDRMPVS
ncbi:hypothetical protein E1295_19895 [Nonomuraea mesophila]|uniref:Uncharacterized protein n=1 Tax=Nonomuraea mesophila TaxID=2530382 RepID=A0A4R5FGP2_9ACTN|nr:hypothetical protein [Nonomuraea mesophila]TDE49915.1 hypothetical protein E1295_19895 [Nonomuraea mesophila]